MWPSAAAQGQVSSNKQSKGWLMLPGNRSSSDRYTVSEALQVRNYSKKKRVPESFKEKDYHSRAAAALQGRTETIPKSRTTDTTKAGRQQFDAARWMFVDEDAERASGQNSNIAAASCWCWGQEPHTQDALCFYGLWSLFVKQQQN